MPRQIISLHIGQCGNQIGHSFWNELCKQHGIDICGNLKQQAIQQPMDDRKDVFFYQSDDDRYVPRALLIDLQPRVIHKIKSTHSKLYNPENMFISKDGGGAGNNWASGYQKGKKVCQDIIDMIDRQAQNSDSLQGFIVSHSISGGTGSGLGSYLLQRINQKFPKKIISTYSVFPTLNQKQNQMNQLSTNGNTDVVVAGYNSILSCKRLIQNADSVVVIDNQALYKIIGNKNYANHQQQNSLVSRVMAASTATLRYPSYMNNNLTGMLASLIPSPRCHFLMTSYTPLTIQSDPASIRKTNVIDVIRRLLQPKNIMANVSTRQGKYMSILNIIQGDVDATQIHKSLQRIKQNKMANFIQWGPSSVQITLSQKSKYIQSSHKVSGLMIANNTCINSQFKKINQQFTKLMKRKAFLKEFQQNDVFKQNLDQFDDCHEVLKDLIKQYTAIQKSDYSSLSNSDMQQ